MWQIGKGCSVFFFEGTPFGETHRVFPLISRMVPRVNQILKKAKAFSIACSFKGQTCHLWELNLGGGEAPLNTNHSG
jgi:hypothetical protein